MDPCPHEPAMPDPRACVECMYEGNLPRPESRPLVTVERSGHAARFSGQCEGCNLGIHPGEPVSRLSDGTWQHDRCAEALR